MLELISCKFQRREFKQHNIRQVDLKVKYFNAINSVVFKCQHKTFHFIHESIQKEHTSPKIPQSLTILILENMDVYFLLSAVVHDKMVKMFKIF